MNKYRFVEGITHADFAFEAYGKDLNELFQNAALATTEVMVDYNTLAAKETHELKLNTRNIERLLYDFLSELIFLKDSQHTLFKDFSIRVAEHAGRFELYAKMQGEKIDIEKHTLGDDVKSITMHEFKIEKMEAGWKATVVLDV